MNFIKTNLKYITVYGLAFIILYVVVWPMWSGGGLALFSFETIKDKEARSVTATNDFNNAETLKQKAEAMQKAYNSLDPSATTTINQAVPVDHDTPRLINDLSDLISKASNGSEESARMSQTRFDKYDPNREIKGSSGTFQIAFSVKGSYSTIKEAVKMLETNRRIFNITQLSLQPKDSYLELSITMNAFYLKDGDAKSGSAGAGAGSLLNSPVMKEISLLAGQNVDFNIIKSNIEKLNKMSYNPVFVPAQGSAIRPNPFINKQ